MKLWQTLKTLFSATKLKAGGLKETPLKNGRIALVDKNGNFKGFKK